MANILILDDEPVILDILTEILQEEFGHEVTAAGDGYAALELLEKHQYDLFITDFHMPIVTGGMVINRLRASSNINSKTPIVVLSAYVEDARKDNQAKENISFYNKPIDVHVFSKFIEDLLK